MKNLYALWKSDHYPYILGGKITRMKDNGNVEAENFGKGYWFNPIKIVPEKLGKQILSDVKNLETERRNAKKKFDKEWADILLESIAVNSGTKELQTYIKTKTKSCL